MYPTKLLSRIQYKYIELNDLIGKGFFVIRRPVEGEDLIDPDTGQINASAVCEFTVDKHGKLECFGLSLNLYGIFKINDLTFVLLNLSNTDYWQEGMEDIDIDSLKYEEVEVKEGIMINIDDLQKITFDYNDENRGERKDDPIWKEAKVRMDTSNEYKKRY